MLHQPSQSVSMVVAQCRSACLQSSGHQHAGVVLLQVESLAASRQSGASSEPADSVRAVNALLTQLDALKGHSNVMVRCHTASTNDLAHGVPCTPVLCTTLAQD